MAGEGPPLLMLHGFTGSLKTWEPFVPRWSGQYKLVMVDVIGHGKSDAPPDPARYGMDFATRDLASLCDALNIKTCAVLGYSMGGRLALAFATRYPERVNALILVSSSPGLKGESERQARVKQDEQLATFIEQNGVRAFVERWEKLPLFASQSRLPRPVREKIRRGRLQNSANGLANSLRGMGTGRQPSLWEAIKKANVPTLLLVGEEDLKFSRIAEEMERLMPRATRCQVPAVGHAVHVEQPDVFDKIVRDYLKEVFQ